MNWKKGDILRGKNGVKHPIIFLSGYNDDHFIGAMITSSPTEDYAENILMKVEHFEEKDELGKKFKIVFEDSYLVTAKLFKNINWGPFKKTGQLTPSGVVFVESALERENPVLFGEHEALMRSNGMRRN